MSWFRTYKDQIPQANLHKMLIVQQFSTLLLIHELEKVQFSLQKSAS